MEERRSNILIDPGLQLRIVGLVVLSALVTAILAIGFVGFTLNLLYPHIIITQSSEILLQEKLYTTALLVAGSWVVGIAIMCFLTLVITNRFVGPLTRLTDELRQMRKSGDLQLVSIREDDYVEDFVLSLNKLLLHVEEENDSLTISE